MSYFHRIAEQKIREAIKNGEFDNLEGAGKALDHSEYFNAPPEMRMCYHILRNAGVVPDEVEILNGIHRITKQIKAALTPEEKEKLIRDKVILQSKYNLMKELRVIGRD